MRFAVAHAAGRRTGSATASSVVTLREFPRTGQPGALISMHALMVGESDTVTGNERLHAARVFSVPAEVDPSGYGFFGAHIALEQLKPLAPVALPRPHRPQRSAYLGRHLPNTKTNQAGTGGLHRRLKGAAPKGAAGTARPRPVMHRKGRFG